jgi:hypothetical protein
MATGSVWWARFRAVLTFEVRAQAREPLTTLYALVFFFLALGYAASSAVELVSDRGNVPRTAPWALMLAFGGLTAFGQVITTMIATTAMLRDEAQRTRALVATSGLGVRTWFAARVCAALVVMLGVYAAMPIGIGLGTVLSRGNVVEAFTGSARAYGVVTVPTMVTVTLLLASAALLTQRVLGVLSAALALVAIWQLALSLAGSPSTAIIGAWLDPFGNAPVLVETHGWTEAQRTLAAVPLDGLFAANRALWVTLAAAVATVVLRMHAHRAFAPSAPATSIRDDVRMTGLLASSRTALASVRRFTAGWMQFDGGWRVVTALAVLNALFNAVTRTLPAADTGVAMFAAPLALVTEHSRLFLILLATVYAGELVWRERDVRVYQLLDAMPVSRGTVALGRMQGLLLAQRQVVVPLAVVGLAVGIVRGGVSVATLPDAVPVWLAWSVFVLWLPYAQLTLLSLAVHVLLDHKVMAHLLLITGWVAAVVLDGQGVAAWWLRFAEPTPLLESGAVAWEGLVMRGAYWSAVSAGLVGVCWWRWRAAVGK